jgi:hypothetical protein
MEMESREPEWTGTYILADSGDPEPELDIAAWERWFEIDDRRLVDATDIAPGVSITTLFLGLDYSFFPLTNPLLHKPVLWETMILGGPLDQESRRYTSHEDAVQGHASMTDKCRLALENWKMEHPDADQVAEALSQIASDVRETRDKQE